MHDTYYAYTIIVMDVDFDPAKDTINIDKHGVSLAFGRKVFDDPDHVVIPTIREEDGERRFRVVGIVGGRLWTGVHVVRGTTVRFIFVRKSNDGEARTYHRP